MIKQDVKKYCKNIKLLLTDVDGVLTDGGMYYDKNGDIMKKFHTRDGMGVSLLKRNNIPTIVITKEKTIMVKQWAKKMNIEKLFDGILLKESLLEEICDVFHVSSNEIAFIGDDVNDLELMKKVGFSATPKDGIYQARKIANYTCKSKGGEGALREIADLILTAKFSK
jgi:3-deoxy-D-manno-octulosonate 8-phosphate phosphatase (KDO 8-P phosphatase)